MSKKKFFSSENIINILGGEEYLQGVVINPATAFVSGNTTSVFNAASADKSDYIKLNIYNCSGADQKLIKKKTFTQIDKCNEYVENDKKEKYDKFKNEQLEKDPDINESDIKVKFNEKWKYEVIESKINTLDSATNSVMAGLGTYGAAKTLYENPTIISDKITDLLANITETITTNAMSIVNSNVEKIVSFSLKGPKIMEEETLRTFNKNKKTLNDFLGDIQTDFEELNKKQEEENSKNAEEKSQKNVLKTMNNIKSYSAKILKDSGDIINTVQKYIVEGPDTVATFVNNFISDKLDKINSYTNQAVDSWSKEYNDFWKKQGQQEGEKLAASYNESLEIQAKKIINDIETQKASTKMIAFSTKQKAALKIMSMTGTYVSV